MRGVAEMLIQHEAKSTAVLALRPFLECNNSHSIRKWCIN